MAATGVDKIFDELGKMSVLDLVELKKKIEDEWGITAAAPVAVAAAKALSDAARTTRILTIRGGLLDGRAMSGDEVENLAKLPPADVVRAQVLGAITAPLTTIVGLFTAPLQNLIGLIDARIEQLQAEGDTSGATAEADTQTAESQAEETPAEPDAEPALWSGARPTAAR